MGVGKEGKKLLFLEVGALEIVSVFVVLFLIFGLLNYFNILRIDKAFPSLSFLPHASSKYATVSPIQPGPHPVTQPPYNPLKAKASLRSFLGNILQPASQPPGLNTPQFNPSHGYNIYQVTWTLPNKIPAVASLFFRKNTSVVDKMRLAISLPPDPTFVIDETHAQGLIQQYVKENASLAWHCGNTTVETYCEKFVDSLLGGQGYGVAKDTKNNLAIYACYFPAEIPTNLQIKSCVK